MSRPVLDPALRAAWLAAVEALPVGWRGDVADIARRADLQVPEPAKSWGGLARLAHVEGLLVPVGFMQSTRKTARGSYVREWARVQPGQERKAS